MNPPTPRPALEEKGRVAQAQQHLLPNIQAGWIRRLPGWQVLRRYEPAWLPHDVMAGLLACALFGPSRILGLGPGSSLPALNLAVVLPLSAGDPQRAIALAGKMELVSGALCVAAGFARLGFIAELLSKPIRYGYMNGMALTVIASQLPALVGFGIDAHGLLDESRRFMSAQGRSAPCC